MEKTKLILNINKETVRDLKITMAKLYLDNRSQIVENLIKDWVAKHAEK